LCVPDGLSDEPPHWMASLHHLTEDSTNHRVMPQLPFTGATWSAAQVQHPPPGFHQPQIRPTAQVTDSHKLAEGLQ